MPTFYTQLQKWFYTFTTKLFNVSKDLRIYSIDFSKPWWHILGHQKITFAIIIFSEIIQSIYTTLLPFIFGKAINEKNFDIIIYNLIFFFMLEFANRVILRYFSVLYNNIVITIKYQAYKYFLTVDPIFHSTKSSGQIVSKIENTTSTISSFLSMMVSSFVPIITGFATVIVTMFSVDLGLGLVSLGFYILLIFVNIFMSYLANDAFNEIIINARDHLQSITTENILQNWFIRSTFATSEQVEKNRKAILKSSAIFSTSWLSFGLITTTSRYLYAISTTILTFIIIQKIEDGEMNLVLATALIITYLGGSKSIIQMGEVVQTLAENNSKLNDLYRFISGFGKQTYPVLNEDELVNPELKIKSKNLK